MSILIILLSGDIQINPGPNSDNDTCTSTDEPYSHRIIPKYRHYDIAYCYIIVPNKSQSLCCRRKKASIFQALKLEIYLKYAFNLNLCYYNFVLTPTCFNGVCMYG